MHPQQQAQRKNTQKKNKKGNLKRKMSELQYEKAKLNIMEKEATYKEMNEMMEQFTNFKYANDLWFLVPLVWSALMGILCVMHKANPLPYMDEVFHIPQIQRFCEGNLEWDPKITTLPGSYILPSIIYGKLMQFGISDGCTVFNLRAFNCIIGALTFAVIYLILPYYVKPFGSRFMYHISALNTLMLPILFFFNFFAYTDVTSTFFLLCMHYYFLKQQYGISSIFGAFAIFTRQTNVVFVIWHCFIMFQRNFHSIQREILECHLVEQIKMLTDVANQTLQQGIGYTLVMIMFGLFIIVNEGIVVGDKDAHQASPNFPQLGYFTLVSGLFASPYLIYKVQEVVEKIIEEVSWAIPAFIQASVLYISVYFNTVEHPYLIADNRHYTFYIWRRLYKSTMFLRYLMIPFYVMVYNLMYICLPGLGYPSLTFLIICSIPAFCLQSLLEFRYFIPTYIFFHLMIKERSKVQLLMEFLLLASVNFFTIYMYIYRPFESPGYKEKQRFMW